MQSDYYALLNAIEDQQSVQFEQARAREEAEQSAQQKFATVLGHDRATGNVWVSVDGSGAIGAVSLSNGSLPVGSVVSYFRQAGDSVGFVDAIGSG